MTLASLFVASCAIWLGGRSWGKHAPRDDPRRSSARGIDDPMGLAIEEYATGDPFQWEAAERRLCEDGAPALERVEAELSATTDKSRLARLEFLMAGLKICNSTDAFASACRDQWFLSMRGKTAEAVEHRTAELSKGEGPKTWTFRTDAWVRGSDGHVRWAKHKLTAKHDPALTPVEVELFTSLEDGGGEHTLWRFDSAPFAARVLRRSLKDLFEAPLGPDEPWRTVTLHGPIRGAVVLDWGIERVLERFSIAGYSRLECTIVLLLPVGGHAYQTVWRSGPEFLRAGVLVKTWKLETRTGPYEPDDEFDISQESGLIEHRKAADSSEWLGSLGDSSPLRASTEAECRATGLVPP